MSAAESLSVGSVASIGSQEGVSQTSGALSIYGPFAGAALSTTQRSVVSNNETALSAVHVDAHESRVQGGKTRLGSARKRVQRIEAGHHQEAALQLHGVPPLDSVMAVAYSGNDGASSVGQIMQGESAVEEQSVNVNNWSRMDRSLRPMTRGFFAYMTAHAARTATLQEKKIEQTDSLCSLAQSNSVEAYGDEAGDEVESISDRTAGRRTSLQRSNIPFTDIPGDSMSIGSSFVHSPNTWPLIDGDRMQSRSIVDSPMHEAGQTSIGMEPSDSAVVDQEDGAMLDQGSLVESNDGVESVGRQASLSVHQAMEMHLQTAHVDHYGIKRKDTSFDGGHSGKRRH